MEDEGGRDRLSERKRGEEIVRGRMREREREGEKQRLRKIRREIM